MALDRGRALCARFRSGATVRMGLRLDRRRNAGTDCSAEETGCGGVISICAEPDVFGVLRRMGRALGGLRTREPGCYRNCVRAAVIGTTLFVLLYEEPTLRKTFGAEYEEYCRNVPRWVPRTSAWNK